MVRSLAARAGLALASAAVAFALIEATSSAVLSSLPAEAALPEELAAGLRSTRARAPVEPDPWLGYRIRPGVDTPAIRTNAQGLRNDAVAEVPPPDTLRVLLLGGSTAWGLTSSSNEDTLAAHLERWFAARADELPALAGRRVEVLNGAAPGYVTWQGALAYAIDRRDLAPHVVVSIDGANDVHAGIRHGRAGVPLDASRRAEAPRSLTGALAAWWGYRAGRLKCVKLARELDPPTLADTARDGGALAVGVLQPMCFLEGAGRPTPFEAELARIHDLRMPGRNAYYEACFAAFRDVHAALGAARPDLSLVDATRVFAGMEEIAFVDHCHLTTAGRARLAEALGAAIAAGLEARDG